MAKGLELRRRSLERYINCKSETVHTYLNERGGQLYGAIERVATMYQYTDDNPEHRAAVEANFKPLFDDLLLSINDIEREGRSFVRANRKYDSQKIVVPEHYNHQVPFTHWLFNDVIESLEKIDKMVSKLEIYWISGLIDDSQMRNIRIRSIRPFGQFTNRIYEITNKLRNLSSGGRMRDQVRQQVSASFLEDIPEYKGDTDVIDSDVVTNAEVSAEANAEVTAEVTAEVAAEVTSAEHEVSETQQDVAAIKLPNNEMQSSQGDIAASDNP